MIITSMRTDGASRQSDQLLPVVSREVSDEDEMIDEALAVDGYSGTSTVAGFTLLPIKSLSGLRDLSIQKKALSQRRDDIESHLLKHGKPLVHYYWSGYIMGTLLLYLQEACDIDLITTDFYDLGFAMTLLRGRSSFILTSAHKSAYLQKLKPAAYSESDLRAYYEAFNEKKNEEAGKAMLDGISLIRTNLFYVNGESFIVLTLG